MSSEGGHGLLGTQILDDPEHGRAVGGSSLCAYSEEHLLEVKEEGTILIVVKLGMTGLRVCWGRRRVILGMAAQVDGAPHMTVTRSAPQGGKIEGVPFLADSYDEDH